MQNLKKLKTREDVYNIHKMLGIYCTISYAYRYVLFCHHQSMNFINLVDFLSVIPHLILPFTSLFFKVLAKRILSKPTIIWEEMRLHSMVFSTRSIAIFYYHYFFFDGVQYDIWYRLIIVLSFHLVADYITSKYGKEGETTIRVNPESAVADSFILTIFRRFYSLSQIVATATLILPGKHTFDTSFIILIAIHYAAFLMTLNRKNIISITTYNLGYFVSLVLVNYVITKSLGLQFYLFCSALFFLRAYVRINKYLLWIFAVILYVFFF